MNNLIKEIIAEAERMEDMAGLCEMAECFAVESGDEAEFFKQLQQAIAERMEYYRYARGVVSVWDDNHEEMRDYFRSFLLRVKVLAMKKQRSQEGSDSSCRPSSGRGLRKEFLTDKAKAYFAKAERAGLVKVLDEGKLEWTGGTKALLAYFIDRCSIALRMRADVGEYEKQNSIPWNDFEVLLGFDDKTKATLVQTVNKYRNKYGKLPKEYEKIDKLDRV